MKTGVFSVYLLVQDCSTLGKGPYLSKSHPMFATTASDSRENLQVTAWMLLLVNIIVTAGIKRQPCYMPPGMLFQSFFKLEAPNFLFLENFWFVCFLHVLPGGIWGRTTGSLTRFLEPHTDNPQNLAATRDVFRWRCAREGAATSWLQLPLLQQCCISIKQMTPVISSPDTSPVVYQQHQFAKPT